MNHKHSFVVAWLLLFFFEYGAFAELAPGDHDESVAGVGQTKRREVTRKGLESVCDSVKAGLNRIRESAASFAESRTCFNCHHSSMALRTFSEAYKAKLLDGNVYKDEKERSLAPLLKAKDRRFEKVSMERYLKIAGKDRIIQKIGKAIESAIVDLKAKGSKLPENWSAEEVFKLTSNSADLELKSLTLDQVKELMDESNYIHGGTSTMSAVLSTLDAAGIQPDDFSALVVRYLLLKQSGDGGWTPEETRRGPSEGSRFTTTADVLAGLARYGNLQEKNGDGRAAYEKGISWLTSQKVPPEIEDKSGMLRGLVSVKSSPFLDAKTKTTVNNRISELVRSLKNDQHDGGGWAQKIGMAPDAYATGQALLALRGAGMALDDPVYQKGALFLVNSQNHLGEWLVKSRAEGQFDPGVLLIAPGSSSFGATEDDLKGARLIRKIQFKLPEETRGGLNELRAFFGWLPSVAKHHRFHSQFISFMGTTLATRALIPLCLANESRAHLKNARWLSD